LLNVAGPLAPEFLRHAIQYFLVALFHRPIKRHHAPAIRSKLGATSAGASDGALHHGLIGKGVHGVDRIPSRFIGKSNQFRRLRN